MGIVRILLIPIHIDTLIDTTEINYLKMHHNPLSAKILPFETEVTGGNFSSMITRM